MSSEMKSENSSSWAKWISIYTLLSFIIGGSLERIVLGQNPTADKVSAFFTFIAAVAACFATYYAAKYAKKQNDLLDRQTNIFDKQTTLLAQQTVIFDKQTSLLSKQNILTDEEIEFEVLKLRYEIVRDVFMVSIAIRSYERITFKLHLTILEAHIKANSVFGKDITVQLGLFSKKVHECYTIDEQIMQIPMLTAMEKPDSLSFAQICRFTPNDLEQRRKSVVKWITDNNSIGDIIMEHMLYDKWRASKAEKASAPLPNKD